MLKNPFTANQQSVTVVPVFSHVSCVDELINIQGNVLHIERKLTGSPNLKYLDMYFALSNSSIVLLHECKKERWRA